MSIINEALKKTQLELTEKENQDPPAQDLSKLYEKMHAESQPPAPASASAQAPEPEPEILVSTAPKIKAYISQIPHLVIILVLLVGVFFMMQPTGKKKSEAKPNPKNFLAPIKKLTSGINKDKKISKTAPATPAPSAPEPVKAQTPKPEPPEGNLVLNGIMIDQSKTVALINNEIYEVGDSVDGKKIMSIDPKGVELLDGDKTIFLDAR